MTSFQIALLSLAAILVLVYGGLHVPVAFCLVSLVGIWAIKGNLDQALSLLGMAANDAVASYDFGVIPLFVLMGLLVSVADLGRDAFVSANILLGRIRGGLGIATVGANAIFAAVTGVSIASAAVFTKVAVPEMIRLGYRPRFAVGVVAGSSVLGMLIPPSLLLIVYGLLSQQSIGDLFLAGIIPGLALAFVFIVMIVAFAVFRPGMVYEQGVVAQEPEAAGSIWDALVLLTPLVLLAAGVIGGIYAGWFTATESGAIGALGAFVIAALRRRLTWAGVWKVLVETGQVTVVILFVIIAANIYTRLIALSGLAGVLSDAVTAANLGAFGLMLIYTVIVLLLGTILDGVSIMLIMVPMFLPLLAPFNVDLIWFGIMTVLAVEVGLLTPPFGLSVFVIKGTLDDPRITLGEIFRGAAPFALAMVFLLAVIAIFPKIATILVK
jgi:tripartite ATP-independent transporter DctM subunit